MKPCFFLGVNHWQTPLLRGGGPWGFGGAGGRATGAGNAGGGCMIWGGDGGGVGG